MTFPCEKCGSEEVDYFGGCLTCRDCGHVEQLPTPASPPTDDTKDNGDDDDDKDESS